MEIYDITKQYKLNLNDLDLTQGHLEQDYLTITIPESQHINDQGHYIIVNTNPETGDVERQWVVDKPGQEYIPEHIEKIPILIYTPYTDQELEQQEYWDNKERLIKISEHITQDKLGIIVPNIEQEKQEFLVILNEVRQYEGKKPKIMKEV